MPGMSEDGFQVAGRSGATSGVHVVQVKGPITYATSPAVRDAVVAAGPINVIIDLTDVPSIDSTAIGTLVRAFVTCNKAGRKMALVGLNHRVTHVLQLTGVDSLFDRHATLPEAEAALS